MLDVQVIIGRWRKFFLPLIRLFSTGFTSSAGAEVMFVFSD